MERLLLLSHAVSGGIVLLLGLISLLNRKGSSHHIIIGRIYVGTMWWICLSAFLIISFYRFSFFLLVIGVLTFYSSFVGLRVVKRKSSNSDLWYDWLVSIITLLFGLGLFLYGVRSFLTNGEITVFGSLSLLFGALTMLPAYIDLRNFTSKAADKKLWWLEQHIRALGGSYIAAITAFAVQNGSIFLPEDFYWLAWILPSLVFSPVLSILRRSYVKKISPKLR